MSRACGRRGEEERAENGRRSDEGRSQTDKSGDAGVCGRCGVFAVREGKARAGGKASDFQRAASKVVSAHGQSDFLEKLLPEFTEEEAEIFRRGRNAKKATKSKNATTSEYNRSTGFEAVLGFLYLSGNLERLEQLFSMDDKDSYKIDAVSEGYKP